MKDRMDYFYGSGELEFFKTRMQKYQSTVFRCNMPPGPFISRSSAVVCLLDAVSFRTLFDNSKVEKRNVLDGTYMPTTSYTGGYRTCAFLDPSEPNHGVLKGFFLSLLSKKKDKFIPIFRQVMADLFSGASNGSSYFNDLNDTMSFQFVFRFICDNNPSPNGPKIVDLWIFFQLAPLLSLGLKFLPNFLEDLLLHTVTLPSFLVKSKYKKLYDAVYESAAPILDEAEKLGLQRDEACHNLVFFAGEIRSAVKENGVTLAAVNAMALTKSVVYEALRIEPPVSYQYGKAKHDFKIRNHDSTFSIKRGEMLFGFQPIATKDPKVFENPDEFVPERFVGEGEKLIEYVYWSNGRETDEPTAANKQCAGKNMVVLLCRLMVVEFFLRYDTFKVETGKLPVGSSVTFKSLTKATS